MAGRQVIGALCLLAYLLGWVSSARAAPLLVMLVGYAHEAFVTYEADGLELTLHHPGHADSHHPEPSAHHHDGLDDLIQAVTGAEDHSDHVLHIPAHAHEAVLCVSGCDTGDPAGPPPCTGYAFPAFVAIDPRPASARAPPHPDSRLLALRSTVLLI